MFILFDINDINKLSRIKNMYLTKVQNGRIQSILIVRALPKNFLLSN